MKRRIVNGDQALPYSALLMKQLVAVSRDCTLRELRVLMAFAIYADGKGAAWPSVETLAEDADLPERHVRAALKSLASASAATRMKPGRPVLLAIITKSSGPGRSTYRRLELDHPQYRTKSVRLSGDNIDSEKGDRFDNKGGPIQTEIPHQIGPQRGTDLVRLTGHEEANEQAIEEFIPPAAVAAGDGGEHSGDAGDEVQSDPSPALTDAAGTPDLASGDAPAEDNPAGSDDLPVRPKATAKPKRAAKAPTGDHAALVKHFCDGWQEQYDAAYPFAGGKDGSHVKTILATGEGLSRAREMVTAFLADADPFLVKARHTIGLMISRLPRYVAADAAAQDEVYIPTPEQLYAAFENEDVTMEQCEELWKKEMRYHGRAVPA